MNTALICEMERTGFSAVICARRIRDRRVIVQRMELERRQAVRRAVEQFSRERRA